MSCAVRCWGEGFGGRLGYGDEIDRGDDETPAAAGDVPLGGPCRRGVGRLVLPTCALLTGWRLRRRGRGHHGRLGYGNGVDVGSDELLASVGDVDLGAMAASVAAGGEHTCAVTRDGFTRCFGRSIYGQLGARRNQATVGDDETPAEVGNVPLIDRAVAIDTGADHTCAVLRSGSVRCWGTACWGGSATAAPRTRATTSPPTTRVGSCWARPPSPAHPPRWPWARRRVVTDSAPSGIYGGRAAARAVPPVDPA